MLSSLHQDAAKCGWLCLAQGPRMAVPPAPAQRRGTLGTHRGWAARIPRSRSSVSSRQTWCRTGASPRAGSTTRTPPAPRLREEGRWVPGPRCAWRAPGARGDPVGALGSTVPTYRPWCGWVGSRLSPASPPESSCLGTHTAPQHLPGWGTRCAAPSRRCLPGLRCPGGWQPPRLREGAQPHAQHLCSGDSGGPARPGAASRGRVAAPCSRWPGQAVPAATPGTAAGSSPGRGCPAGTATAPARLGGRQENNTHTLELQRPPKPHREVLTPSVPPQTPDQGCCTGARAAVLVGSVLNSRWLLSQLVVLGIPIAAV